jgi:diguanylate cyclase (GGDEF)-like protein/PAS domain S-box-containing protein
VNDDNKPKQNTERRRQAEYRTRRHSSDIEALSAKETRHLFHELKVHQLQLEMQNEELRRIQQELEVTRDEYANLFDFAPIGYVTISGDGLILKANIMLATLLGRERYTLVGQPLSRFVYPEHQETYYRHCKRVFATQTRQACEIRLKKADGTSFPVQLESITVQDDKGKFNRCRIVVSDITARKQAEEQVHYRANYDQLTGLANRVLFTEHLSQAMRQAHRNGTYVALLLIDLDRFKHINDTLGHVLGDKLLQDTAWRLKRCVRDNDTVARLGGDEFTIVLPEITHGKDAAIVAEKMVVSLSQQPFRLEVHEVFTSASIGITVYPTDADELSDMLKHADLAMYRAKGDGGNAYQFYAPSMTLQARQHMHLEQELRQALKHNAFELYYQPIIRLASGRLSGAEALLRWHRPGGEVVTPAHFLGVAEDTGLIKRIGEWALYTACREAQGWYEMGLPESLRVAVNLSSRQFKVRNYERIVARILREIGLPADLLTLEITESLMMDRTEKATAGLRTLRDMGIHLTVDDFGTGYSSLSYLRRFPVDGLKIDRSFIRDLKDDAEDAALVKAIITMAHTLTLEVIAEGVETPAQLTFLRAQSCDLAQGFYLSKPLPADAFANLIKTWDGFPVDNAVERLPIHT